MIDAKKLSKNLKVLIMTLVLILTVTFFSSARSTSAFTATSSISTVLTANLSNVLYISNSNCGSSCTLNVTPTGGGIQCTTYDNLTYYTNNGGTLTVSIFDNSATSAALTNGANTIPTMASTSTPATQSVVNTWGYSVNVSSPMTSTLTFSGGFPVANASASTVLTTGTSPCNTAVSGSWQFVGMPLSGSPQSIFSESAGALTSTYATIFYGLYVNTAKASGAYTTTIVYQAVTS